MYRREMIDRTLKVLLLEDLKTDQELIKISVLKVAPHAIFIIAQNKEDFEGKINWGGPDVILSDYKLPGYNGLEALLLVREKMPHVPFIFITGTLNNEEKVAEAILKGASGYILKNDLVSLPAKLEEVLIREEAKFREKEAFLQKQRRNKILLQKLQSLIQTAASFPQQDEANEILEEILDASTNLI